jgi:hypothetical protein
VGGPGSAARRRRAQQQALEQLISWQWLIGEAVARGVAPSAQELQRRLNDQRQSSFPGGEAELEAFLHATGQTVADLRLEAEAAVAAAKLGEMISSEAPKATASQIAAYYQAHRQSFLVPERREVLITNRKTNAEAEQVVRELRMGKSPTRLLQLELRELPSNPAAGSRPKLENAMRAAVSGAITGPVKQLALGTVSDYFVFEVRKVRPATRRTLAQVRGALGEQLDREARQRALAAFVGAWRQKWIAKTDCQPGYVVQKCRQYSGPIAPEDPLRLD